MIRRVLKQWYKNYKWKHIRHLLKNKSGIEFGGPTALFSEPQFNMRLYPYLHALDGANLFKDNHFQNKLTDTYNYYKNKTGKQYDIDVANIEKLPQKYDFLLNSHIIEHIANPIKALLAWKTILNSNGYILSVIPHYQNTFDHNRPLTTMEHLISDYDKQTKEDDTTHIEEQKKLHDWNRGGHPEFYELCKRNGTTRVVHHHCFDIHLAKQLFQYCKFQIIESYLHDPTNIIILGRC